MRTLFVLLLLTLASALAAPPDDLTLQAVSGKPVVIELAGGLEVSGQILSFDATNVVIAQEGGKVASIPRADIGGLRLVEAAAPAPDPTPAPAAAAPPAAPAPAAAPTGVATAEVAGPTAAELREQAKDERFSGIIKVAVGLPVCGAIAVLGWTELRNPTDQVSIDHPIVPAGVALVGMACFAGNLFDGPMALKKAKDLEAEAAALEAGAAP